MLEKLDVEKLLTIDQSNLAEEFTKQAATYAYWSGQLAEAERIRAVVDNRKDQEYAAADAYYRDELDSKGQKYTEAVIRGLVTRDEDYQKFVEEMHNADYVYNALRGLLKALDMRSSMLISLGATLRAEQDMTGMTIRDRRMQETVEEVKSTVNKARKKQ